MQNLLITGGLGYIGSKFIESFSENYNIYILDTRLYEKKNTENFKIIDKDIRDIQITDIENMDLIVHMSELSNDPLGELNKDLTTKINHLATKKLLNLCNNSSVKKVIYMSSCSVYGKNENLVNELSSVSPLTSYSRSKVANEEYIQNNTFSFETIIFRNATVYGYSKNLRLDLVINELSYDGFTTGKINLLSDGSPKRPFVHVFDLVNIINIFLKSNKNFDKEVFNVGSNDLNYSIKEVALTIGKILQTENIYFGEKDEDQRSYYVDFSKLFKTMENLKMKYNLEDGITDLLKNFENHEFDNNTKRIKKINFLLDEKLLDLELRWQ